MSVRRGQKSRWLPFLGLTLVLHQVVIVGGWIWYRLYPPSPIEMADEVELDWIDSSSLDIDPAALPDPTGQGTLAQAESAATEAEKKRREEEERPTPPGQVVELPEPAEEKVPKEAKFVSEYNTSVERETQARGSGDIKARPGPKGATAPAAASRAQAKSGAPPSPEERKEPAVPPMAYAPTPPGQPGRDGLSPPIPGEGALQERDPDGLAPEERAGSSEASPTGPEGIPLPSGVGASRSPSLAQLIPTDRELARSVGGGGGGGSIDYLKDIEEGETTALSSKRWKFASFFNRVKRTVAEHWNPSDEYRRNDPTGNIYGMRDRVTVLRVALRPDGSLDNVLVEQASGVAFLDDVALEAFRSAQPFPNPPRQLVDGSGMIQFRFAFIFEISSTPSFKVFRYN